MKIKRKKFSVNRRYFLKTALISGAALRTSGGDGVPIASSILDHNPGITSQLDTKNESLGRIIDTHIHLVEGVPDLKSQGDFGNKMINAPVEVKAEYLKREMEQAGIGIAFGMGHLNGSKEDPLGIASTLSIEALATGRVIGIIDPRKTSREHLLTIERQIERERNKIVALKAYLGYLHYGPEDPTYVPYYKLAAKYKLPFIFHTGDNWSKKAKVKFAHPLRVDEVAVDHPSVNFVIAHFGNPWLIDAAEVVWKNDNVWADLSGLYVGDEKAVEEILKLGSLPDSVPGLVISDVKHALDYAERYDRILYATDWPLAPMLVYRKFMEALIPRTHYEKVFRTNAETLFQVKS